ncbi:MAG: beta strand repeat-containing protein, partial [Akkermansia sp.]
MSDSDKAPTSGDILFSGETMAEDLENIKGSIPTVAELNNSLTSELGGIATLYGGRLRVEDGAKLTVGSFSTAEGSNATLLLKNASMSGADTESTISMTSGSTLDLQGVNTITANSLTMAGGTTITFTLDSGNINTAVLTLNGTLSTDSLTVNLTGTDLMTGSHYKLITVSDDTYAWDASKISVSGLEAQAGDLTWSDGTLYFTYGGGVIPVPTTATWSNGSTDGLWNTSSKNWTQDGNAYAYKDGVDVVFGDTGAGNVTLVGTLLPKSVLVNSSQDYTWTGDGTLSGGMTLTKQGTGKLTIETANDYTGGTVISGGTIVAAHTSALGTGTVQLNGGTLQIAANGVANAISSAGTSYLVVDNGYTLNLGSAVANTGNLTVTGALDVSKLTLTTEAATHVNTAGTSGASGFAKTAEYSVGVITGGGITNGAGATVTHGSHTLTLGSDGVARKGGTIDYSNYLLTDTDTVSVSAIRGVAGASAATVTQTGGTLTVDGSVQSTTTGGSIALQSGTLSGSISGATINATGGTLAASLTGSNSITASNWALTQAISNNGTLILSGNVNASALSMSASSETLIDVNGTEGGVSGFSKSSGYTVQVVNGGTLVMSSGATVTYGADTLTMDSTGIGSHGGGINYGKYTLAGTDAVSVSTVHGVAGAETAMVNQLGGTLTVDENVTVATTGGAIALQNGVLSGTVNGAAITATGGTLSADLTGSNSITANNWALTQVISNTGTLTLSGSVKADALELESSGNTHVDVDGNLGASGFVKAAEYSVTLVSGGNVVNNGVTVTHGSHTLTLGTDGVAHAGGTVDYSVYELASGDSVLAGRVHGAAADASVKLTGGTLTADESVNVQAVSGSINLERGTLTGSISGTSINATGGTLEASLAGSNSITANNWALTKVLTNSGTLTLSGSVKADALTLTTTAASHVDVVAGNSGDSGFVKAEEYAVTLVSGGSVVNNGVTVTHGSHTLTLGTDGVAHAGGTVDYSVYELVAGDSVSASAIHGTASDASVKQTGGTLTVDENVTVATTGGSIVLTDGTLSGSISGANITATSGTLAASLTGSNSITANNWALKQVINNTGTLTLSGSFDASALSKTSTGETLVDVTGREGGVSGFSKSAGYTVRVVNGGRLVLNGATVKYGTDTLTMDSNGIGSHGGGINYGMYTLAGSDAVSVSAIHGYATEAANALVTQTGGTLTVDEDVTTATSAGRIVLTSGAISGSISGTAAVEVRGSGSISGDNSYTGGTTLTAGTLTVGSAKALGTGRVSMRGGALNLGGLAVANDITAAGGTLNGAAAYTGKLTVQGGLSLGGATQAGSVTLSSGTLSLRGQTLTSGTMTLSGGVLDFASGSSLKVTGALTLGGSTAVKFYTATAGTYTLATVGSLSGNLSSLTLDGLDRSRYGWSLSGDKLLLTLLTTGSIAWDSSKDGQDVVFNGGEDVTIIGDVKPGSVVVDGDGTTTWNGPGSITGDTSVIKNGSGTLVVNNEN